jgi:hypothetical protein
MTKYLLLIGLALGACSRASDFGGASGAKSGTTTEVPDDKVTPAAPAADVTGAYLFGCDLVADDTARGVRSYGCGLRDAKTAAPLPGKIKDPAVKVVKTDGTGIDGTIVAASAGAAATSDFVVELDFALAAEAARIALSSAVFTGDFTVPSADRKSAAELAAGGAPSTTEPACSTYELDFEDGAITDSGVDVAQQYSGFGTFSQNDGGETALRVLELGRTTSIAQAFAFVCSPNCGGALKADMTEDGGSQKHVLVPRGTSGTSDARIFDLTLAHATSELSFAVLDLEGENVVVDAFDDAGTSVGSAQVARVGASQAEADLFDGRSTVMTLSGTATFRRARFTLKIASKTATPGLAFDDFSYKSCAKP